MGRSTKLILSAYDKMLSTKPYYFEFEALTKSTILFIIDFFGDMVADNVEVGYDENIGLLTVAFNRQDYDITIKIGKDVKKTDDKYVYLTFEESGKTIFHCYKDIDDIMRQLNEA